MLNPAALLNRNRHLFNDFKPEAFERRNVHRRIRQQANALNPKIRENLAAEPNRSKNAPVRA